MGFQPSPSYGRVGFRIKHFEACSAYYVLFLEPLAKLLADPGAEFSIPR